MNDNKHHLYAEAAFSSARAGAEPEFNEAVRADALIQATLALAYEQRTANLIATYGLISNAEELLADPITTFLSERIDGIELAVQIKDRLGLS